MTLPEHGSFVLPDHGPLTDCEWEWVVMLRSIVGEHLPPMTLKVVQDLQHVLNPEMDCQQVKTARL